jgi:hypothetical protein
MNQAIANFAKECGISAADMNCLARGVCAELERLKSVDCFIAHEDARADLLSIATEEHCKRFDNFASAYISRPEIRSAVQGFVLADLQAGA